MHNVHHNTRARIQCTYLDSNVHICNLREHLGVGGVEPLFLERCLAAALAAEYVKGQQRSADLDRHDALNRLQTVRSIIGRQN
jgi:hypothetical protein